MWIIIISLLMFSGPALSAPVLSDCGMSPVLAGIAEGRPATDISGNITTGGGDPETCILTFEVPDRRRFCVVRWNPATPYIRGMYVVDRDKITMTQPPRSRASIFYVCREVP